MIKWLKSVVTNLRAKSISQQKLQTAAALEDEAYLHWAYLHGSEYLYPQIIDYLADIKTQTNFDFLLTQMKIVEKERTKISLYAALLNIILADEITVEKEDEMYLQQHLDLLKSVDIETVYKESRSVRPIAFRDKLKDHLGMLEEMKKRNSFY